MKNNKGTFGSFLKRFMSVLSDRGGSILSIVVVIGAALFIITMGVLSMVQKTTQVNQQVDKSENAYLAARSGITMLVDAGKDSGFAQKIINSMGNANPIKMNFGEIGSCEAKVTDLGDSPDGSGIIYKTAKVECTGNYEGKKFKLTRYLKFKQSVTTNKSELNTCAYLHYGNGDVIIDGGIEGDVIIIGEGHIHNDKANSDHAMHDVVCSNELVLSNSGCVYDLIAAGKYLVLGESIINTEVYVGSDELDADNKFTDVLNDDIFCYMHGSKVNSILRCEGVTVVGGDAAINEKNAARGGDDGMTIIDGVMTEGQDAIISGGDLYLGYNVTDAENYHTGDSYKNPASTVNTKNGLTGGDSASQRIYGNVVSGGDVFIDSTAKVFGDIICKGDLTLSSNCQIYGKIYAGGNVTFTSAMNTSIDGAFPEATKRVIYAGGSIDLQSPNIKKEHFEIHEGVSPVPNHSLYFNGSDFVGAADYFKTKYESAPKPTTRIPARLYSLVETRQSDTQVVEKTEMCYGCSTMTRNMEKQCGNCPDTPENAAYWIDVGNEWWHGRQHVTHMGQLEHIPHQKSFDPPQYETVTTSLDKIHITSDTRLVGDINLPDSNYKLYIDTAKNNQNIDILLEGNINVGNGGGIFINDNGGQNQIRIFMTEGSSIKMNSGWGAAYKGMYVISDAAKDTSIDALPANSSGSCIDITKVPQFYIFAEEGKNNINLDVGTYGYIPGYVLTPYLDVKTDSNAHCYVSGTTLGKDKSGSTDVEANYPFFYGMLMCNSLEFHNGTNTFIKYDKRLDDKPDPTDPTKMKKSEVRKAFDEALARDSVMIFESSGGGAGGGGAGGAGGGTLSWTVDSCY